MIKRRIYHRASLCKEDSMEYIMGIDLGTSGAKISIQSADGRAFHGCTAPYPLYNQGPGCAEQRPEEWWQAVCGGIRRLLDESGVSPQKVLAVGFSGQMHGLVTLDERGEVIRPAIIHCDTRAGEFKGIASPQELLDWGILNPVFSGFQAASLAWLKRYCPEDFRRIRHILSPKDYLRFRMTGELGTEWTDASATLLFDVARRRWSPQMAERLGLDPAVLCPVHSPCGLCGTVTPKAAEETGLAAGAKVAFGGADQPMQALGNGVTAPGEATCTIGSGGQLFTGCREPLANPRLNTHTFCHVGEDSWYLLGAMLTAGTAFDHMAGLFYAGESRGLIDREVEADMARPPRLVFLPYLNGERSPHMDESLRGVFFGASLEDGRAQYMRAVMEGICFAMRDMLAAFAALGVEPQRMIASGGFTRSPVWMRMMASVLKKPLSTAENRGYQASMGAAMTAGVAAGLYASPEDAVQRCVRFSSQAVEPDPVLAGQYDQQYQRFREVFRQNFREG